MLYFFPFFRSSVMRASAAIAKPKLPGLAVCCTKHHKGNNVTNYSKYWGIYEKRSFGCGKETPAEILYQKVLQSSLLPHHNKVIVL